MYPTRTTARINSRQNSKMTVEQLLKAIIPLELDDTRTPTYFHGPGGLFNSCAIERDIITAIERPISGLADLLPVYATTNDNPQYGTLTGFEEDGTALPDGPCDDAPSGLYTACIQSAQFGRIPAQTNVNELDRMILNNSRGDTRDLRLVGNLLGATSWTPSGLSEGEILNYVVQSEMVAAGIIMENRFINMVYQGDPVNNTANGGYQEFNGLDLLIATGIVDAITSDPCPRMDSIEGDWDFADVCDVAGADATLDVGTTVIDITGDNLYRTLQRIEYHLWMRSRRQRVGVVEHVIAVRPELWQWMSACLPCQMETEFCDVDPEAGQTIFIDGARQVAVTEQMRSSMTIRINARVYNVIEDDGIRQLDSTSNPLDLTAGQFASHLYFVPLTIQNGRVPVTYLEHLDYSKLTREVQGNMPLDFITWSDDGRFAWVGEQVKFCFQLTAKTQPRLILRTPQLSAKLLNIRYTDF